MNDKRLEIILKETEGWLLRDSNETEPNKFYSPEVLELFGNNLANDSYVRVVRSVIKYLKEEE